MKTRTTKRPVAWSTSLEAVDLPTLLALFDLTPDVAFFVKDVEGRYVAVNDSLLWRHGLKRKSDAIGKRPQDICPGDFGRIPTEQDARVLRTGRPLVDCLELQWHRPREPVWCLTSKLPLRDAAGQIVGIIGFSRDVRAPLGKEDVPAELAVALADFERDPSRPVSPSTLAAQAKVSASRLARLTQKMFDLTPSQWIAKTRITMAARLLRETQATVATIAHECGYSDQSAFTRAFRATTGMTPIECRRLEGNES